MIENKFNLRIKWNKKHRKFCIKRNGHGNYVLEQFMNLKNITKNKLGIFQMTRHVQKTCLDLLE